MHYSSSPRTGKYWQINCRKGSGEQDRLLQSVCMCVYMCAAPMGIPEIVQSAGDLWPFLLSGSLLQLNSFAHDGYESGPISKGKQSPPKICVVSKFNHCTSARQE